MTRTRVPGLAQVARAYGIQTAYVDTSGKRCQPTTEALLALLRSAGAPIGNPADIGDALVEQNRSEAQLLPPVAVAWDGEQAVIHLHVPANTIDQLIGLSLSNEDGETTQWSLRTRDLRAVGVTRVDGVEYEKRTLALDDLPDGYHTLQAELGGGIASCLVIAAPRLSFERKEGKFWGVFLPLYALRTERGGGVGDFTDLRALGAWVREQGGTVVATLPLLASFLDGASDPSPYSPVSRLFWNELYVDVAKAAGDAGFASSSQLLSEYQDEIARQADNDYVDYETTFGLKRRILGEIASCKALSDTNEETRHYARFRATAERQGMAWQSWPQRMRDGDLRPGDYEEDSYRYHETAQLIAQSQLSETCTELRSQGLMSYLDLPLGAHPDGYDTWRFRDQFADGAAVGSPPDSFFTRGQDWGFPPISPAASRRSGHAYFIAVVRNHLRFADILRIDHVMGLHRQFWVPRGLDARSGSYVTYPADEFYSILSLESHRHKAMLVGEDLGTVPSYVRRDMSRHAVAGSYVAQLEAADSRGLRRPKKRSVASLNTHDLPTFASYWQGSDIDERQALGLISQADARRSHRGRELETARLRQNLADAGSAFAEDDLASVRTATLERMAASPSQCVLVNAEDLWLEQEPQNVPGTTAKQRPNWQHKARYKLEQWSSLPGVTETLEKLERARKGKGHGTA